MEPSVARRLADTFTEFASRFALEADGRHVAD
jgi:hypothetical protein